MWRKVKCPDCNGSGKYPGVILYVSTDDRFKDKPHDMPCFFCEGTGEVNPWYRLRIFLGNRLFTKKMIKHGLTLRDIARANNVDVCIISRMEIGAVFPKYSYVRKAIIANRRKSV